GKIPGAKYTQQQIAPAAWLLAQDDGARGKPAATHRSSPGRRQRRAAPIPKSAPAGSRAWRYVLVRFFAPAAAAAGPESRSESPFAPPAATAAAGPAVSGPAQQ